MSLRDVIDAELKRTGESSLASALETAGFADVDATLVNEALLHYAQSAPLEQADSLEQLVTNYHRQSVGIAHQDTAFADDPFNLDAPLNQWLSEEDPAVLDNLDEYDITELDLETTSMTHSDLANATETIEFGSGAETAATGELSEPDVNLHFEVTPAWDADVTEPTLIPETITENAVVAFADVDSDDASDLDDIDFD